MFTIGQRKGLPGGSPRPRYVVDIDPETNRVFVGEAEDLLVEEFEIERVNWSSRVAADEPLAVTVKIRYSHPGTSGHAHSARGRSRTRQAGRSRRRRSRRGRRRSVTTATW